MILFRGLRRIARHGRWALVAGLCVGVSAPEVALLLRPWLPQIVCVLLFLTAVRIGPRAALGSHGDLGRTVGFAMIFQLAMPLLALGAFTALGVLDSVLALAVVLMLAASSVTGSPNFTIMLGQDPAPALRLLIVGTALLPLTVLPVLWFMPVLGDAAAVLGAALRLLLVIFGAVIVAFCVRAFLWPDPTTEEREALDGVTAIALAVMVVGLMSALGPALRTDPGLAAFWMAVAFGVNFGLQIAARVALVAAGLGRIATPIAIIAGNRNIALFLVALPAAVTDPLLLFIGCYQVPMYLTPILLARFHRHD